MPWHSHHWQCWYIYGLCWYNMYVESEKRWPEGCLNHFGPVFLASRPLLDYWRRTHNFNHNFNSVSIFMWGMSGDQIDRILLVQWKTTSINDVGRTDIADTWLLLVSLTISWLSFSQRSHAAKSSTSLLFPSSLCLFPGLRAFHVQFSQVLAII